MHLRVAAEGDLERAPIRRLREPREGLPMASAFGEGGRASGAIAVPSMVPPSPAMPRIASLASERALAQAAKTRSCGATGRFTEQGIQTSAFVRPCALRRAMSG